MDPRIQAKFGRDRHVLGPFLGNLPPEILDVVVGKLGWFQTTFAMAGRTCREAVERVPSARAVLTEEEREQLQWSETSPLAVAVMEGDVEALEWLMRLFEAIGGWRDYRLAYLAAWRGKIESLKCLRANECPWDWRTCMWAAEGGHLEVLQWAHENGCPWDERTCNRGGGRAPGGVEVGASARVPVELGDVRGGGVGRAPGGAAVGASERVRLG